MTLTARGRILFDALDRAMAELAKASDQLRAAQATLLMVRCYPTLATEWLAPRLADFRARHPGIDLRLNVSLEPADPRHDDIDIAITARPKESDQLHADFLFPALYAPVCAPSLYQEGAIDAGTLGKAQLIRAPRETEMWRRWFRLGGVEADLANALLLDNLNLTYQSARHGGGVALGQLFMVMDDLMRGTLVLPVPMVLDDQFAHVMLCLRARRNEPAIAAFRAWLTEAAGRTNDQVEQFLRVRNITPSAAGRTGAPAESSR